MNALKTKLKPPGVLALALTCMLFMSFGAQAQDVRKQDTNKASAADPANSGSVRKADQAKLSSQDRNFIMKAAQSGHAEVEAGRLAASQASDPGIKQFGERMVQDHTKANEELAQIAKARGIEAPNEPDAAHKALAKRLQELKGQAFDRRFMREVGIKDHDTAVKLFEAQSKRGQDAELKAFAEKTLPVLQEHKRMAGDLAARQNRK